MKRRTIRNLLKLSVPLNVALVVLVFVDYFAWDSAGMAALLILFALLVVGLIVLLLLVDRAPFTRIRGASERRSISVYRRDHGPS